MLSLKVPACGCKAQRNLRTQTGRCVRARAERVFDEGAASVANLLKRDEKELMGKESIGSSVYNEFGAQESKEADEESFPEAFHSAASPFGGAPKSTTASPFGPAKTAKKKASGGDTVFGFDQSTMEPESMSPTMEANALDTSPWWSKITTTQIVLFLSFSLISLSMLGTCLVVYKTGAIHLNTDSY